MRHLPKVLLGCLAGLAACGGGSSGGGGGGTGTNAFTGTITVDTAKPAGTTTCLSTHTVTFTAAGATPQAVTVHGGECVQFTSAGGNHQPAPSPVSNTCTELNGSPILMAGDSFTTTPLGAASGTQLCDWYDTQNPPTGGGH